MAVFPPSTALAAVGRADFSIDALHLFAVPRGLHEDHIGAGLALREMVRIVDGHGLG
jgi:hypothetical protein